LPPVATAQVKQDGEREKLIGPVRTIRTQSASLSVESGKVKEGKRVTVSLQSFDPSGNLRESINYERNGAIVGKRVLSYNAQGAKTEEESFNSKGALTSKTVYILGDAGQVIQSDEYKDKELVAKTLYIYDEAKRLAEKRREQKGSLESITGYKYDTAGRLIETTSSNSSGEPTDRTVYTVTPEMIRVEKTNYKSKDSGQKAVRVYDAQKRATDIIFYGSKGTVSWEWRFTYDARGNVTGEEFGNEFSFSKWDYAYEYDPSGNWVKRTTSRWYLISGKETPVPTEVQYRTIDYYPQPYEKAGDAPLTTDERAINFAPGGVLQGEAIKRVEPQYPLTAKSNLVSGTVVVEVTVDEEGNVIDARTLSGHNLLQDAAKTAARGWKFKPTLLSGLPVKVIGTISFNFHL
jgi:TonB family protein